MTMPHPHHEPVALYRTPNAIPGMRSLYRAASSEGRELKNVAWRSRHSRIYRWRVGLNVPIDDVGGWGFQRR